MAGHSKWHNIKNKKGKADAQRAKEFTKLARYIMVAAREGGKDPEYNQALKVAIDKAKAVNMPNDNIDRAIKRGTGEGVQENYDEIIYEGYGPQGIAVMVECLTDNRNRTAPDVRHAFDKNGGNLGQSGCVSFMFDKKGVIAIEVTENIDEDELMMEALELGAEDFNVDDGVIEITTAPENYIAVRKGLENKDLEFLASELSYIPQSYVKLTDEKDIKNMNRLISMLEDNDDVQEIYHNYELPEDLED
ncbi:MAG: YebC/PmpR family DNA-binding transcriptional regulator [Tissierellia bacterium]|nr:YebC/PmpR family DNA-binding transcriptional regulator [Tissierellia bacterium]